MGRSVTRENFDAVLLDLDGVITRTAKLHAAAWKQAFDEYLAKKASDGDFQPFDETSDNEDYVDGKPRFDGAQSFLESRGIHLDFGDPDDAPDKETVCGLANRKNQLFEAILKEGKVELYSGTVDWIRQLRSEGIKIAVVSSSHHCEDILQSAGISDLFDLRIDGGVADEEKLEGKPAPDTYIRAAEGLGASVKRAVVVEDALAGMDAGRTGKFGLVIGVDRKHDAEALKAHGADIVVSDLKEMLTR